MKDIKFNIHFYLKKTFLQVPILFILMSACKSPSIYTLYTNEFTWIGNGQEVVESRTLLLNDYTKQFTLSELRLETEERGNYKWVGDTLFLTPKISISWRDQKIEGYDCEASFYWGEDGHIITPLKKRFKDNITNPHIKGDTVPLPCVESFVFIAKDDKLEDITCQYYFTKGGTLRNTFPMVRQKTEANSPIPNRVKRKNRYLFK
jgi:hypothetical protein